MNEAEAEAFRDYVTASLTRAPESTCAALTASYSPARIAAARSTLALARTLSDAGDAADERWIEPDGPGPACGKCGRTDPAGTRQAVLDDLKHLPGSLAELAGRVGLKDESVPGSEPEYACAGEHECDRVRLDKLTRPAATDFVRPFPSGAGLADHQRHLADLVEARQKFYREGFTGGRPAGYQGKGFEHAPAWLTPLADAAEITLAGLKIARECIALALAQDGDQDYVGLTRGGDGSYVPALEVPPVTFHTWHGTLADPRSRGDLVGAQWAAESHTLPSSLHIPAAQASERKPRKPNARAQEIGRMRARRKQQAGRFWHRP